MRKWTNDDRMMIACCNDGTRPVIFKIERIDIPESEEEKQWLKKTEFCRTRQMMLIQADKFQFKKFMGAVSKTRQFELFIFIKCVTIKLVETNYIAKKVNV